jgi:hypothetical protein
MAIEGYIDGVKGWFLTGWAHDPERPGERLELDVELDGEPLGRCVANLGRPDLAKRGVGDGRHAFRIKLPRRLEQGSDHTVLVRASLDGTVLPLSRRYFADNGVDGQEGQFTLRLDPVARNGGPQSARTARADGGEAETRRVGEWFALVGTEGWLFTYDGKRRFARSLGATPAPPERVKQWVRMLRTRHDRVAALEAGYLPVTIPAKAAVYSDHLPPGHTLAPDGRVAEQLGAALREDPELEVLDLFPVLRQARRHADVFLRQGRQLTWTGAFQAYRAVVKELAKRHSALQVPTATAPELGELVEITDPLRSRERVALVGEDLVPVMNDDEEPEREPELAREGLEAMYVPLSEELAALLGPRGALLERASADPLPSAVIVHDGSGGRLVPFLAEHFSRTFVEVADAPPYGLIEHERPQLVIQLLAEENPLFA